MGLCLFSWEAVSLFVGGCVSFRGRLCLFSWEAMSLFVGGCVSFVGCCVSFVEREVCVSFVGGLCVFRGVCVSFVGFCVGCGLLWVLDVFGVYVLWRGVCFVGREGDGEERVFVMCEERE